MASQTVEPSHPFRPEKEPARVPAECRLSVVVTSRNDDHGGDMLRRFRIFADGLLEQANRHDLTGELVVVEWNPPPGPRLADALGLRARSHHFPIRFLEVPPAAHRRFPNADAIPLFQMIAKNVGIRRARGELVLATNPDLLFSDALIEHLARAPIAHDAMLRIDRTDVAAHVPEGASLEERLAWCDAHVLRIHTRRGTLPPGARILTSFDWRRLRAWLGAHVGSLGRRAAHALRGPDPLRAAARALGRTARRAPGAAAAVLRLALLQLAKLLDAGPAVHTNGCGDFTLLSRERWLALEGYPELPLWSMHLDSLLCYMAVASGAEQRILRSPARLYHVEHGRSWVALDASERLSTFARTPWLDVGLLQELWTRMRRERRPIRTNGADWGLGDLALAETVIVGGERTRTMGVVPVAAGTSGSAAA